MFSRVRIAIRFFFVGLAVGVLLAPRSGEETRRLLREKADSLLNDILDAASLGAGTSSTTPAPATATTAAAEADATETDEGTAPKRSRGNGGRTRSSSSTSSSSTSSTPASEAGV
jgi:hypothetical protein